MSGIESRLTKFKEKWISNSECRDELSRDDQRTGHQKRQDCSVPLRADLMDFVMTRERRGALCSTFSGPSRSYTQKHKSNIALFWSWSFHIIRLGIFGGKGLQWESLPGKLTHTRHKGKGRTWEAAVYLRKYLQNINNPLSKHYWVFPTMLCDTADTYHH